MVRKRSSVVEDPPAASSYEEELPQTPRLSRAPSKPSTPATKRPMESEKSQKVKDSKRKKKKRKKVDADTGAGVAADGDDEDGSPPEEDGKKSMTHKVGRVWSEDDEIVILKGIIRFIRKGIDPVSSLDKFFESIRKSIRANASTEQLNYKIRRLKSKYMRIIRIVEPGKDPVLTNPHDKRCYPIMKEIWGGNEIKKKGSKGDYRTPNTRRSTGGVSTRGKTVSLTDISSKELTEKKSEGNSKEKWRKLHVAELKVFLKRLELVQEQTREVLEALN